MSNLHNDSTEITTTGHKGEEYETLFERPQPNEEVSAKRIPEDGAAIAHSTDNIDEDAELTDDFFDDLLLGVENIIKSRNIKEEPIHEDDVYSNNKINNAGIAEPIYNASALENNLNNNIAEESSLHLPIQMKVELPNGNQTSAISTIKQTIIKEIPANTTNAQVNSVCGNLVEESEEGEASKSPLPENFFDDLLVDEVQERVNKYKEQDIEIKYSEKLKELEELKKLNKEKKRKHKKRKKTKRKSRHSDREKQDASSTDDDDVQHNNKRKRISDRDESSNETNPIQAKATTTIRVRSEFQNVTSVVEEPPIEPLSLNTPTNFAKNESVDCVGTIPGFKRIKLGRCEKNKVLTIEEKVESALKLTTALLNQFDDNEDKSLPLFLYTSTVRKLPSSTSLYQRQNYEDRSPLNVVNNVSYAFNSASTSINLYDFGLERMPTVIANVARKICLDANTFQNKLEKLKLPPKLLKAKEKSKENERRGIMLADPTGSSLYKNVLVQTDSSMFIGNCNAHDVGSQYEPARVHHFGVQTKESSLNGSGILSEDLPLIKLIKRFNDNKLMALHEFAELLDEPTVDNDIDRYRVRVRLLEIYDSGKIPAGSFIKDRNVQPFEQTEMHQMAHVHQMPQMSLIPHASQMPQMDQMPHAMQIPHASQMPQMNHMQTRRDIGMNPEDPRSTYQLPIHETKYYGRGSHRRH